MHIPVSAGSVFNFNKEAYERLDAFGHWAKTQLARSDLMHADETGINIGGKRHWLHCASNASLTWFYPHARRGSVAMDEIGIQPFFKGVLCHDHWKPYIAVPLSNHDEPDSYCIDAHVLLVNRLRHVFEQADSSSRTERSGDPGSRGFNDLLDTG